MFIIYFWTCPHVTRALRPLISVAYDQRSFSKRKIEKNHLRQKKMLNLDKHMKKLFHHFLLLKWKNYLIWVYRVGGRKTVVLAVVSNIGYLVKFSWRSWNMLSTLFWAKKILRICVLKCDDTWLYRYTVFSTY